MAEPTPRMIPASESPPATRPGLFNSLTQVRPGAINHNGRSLVHGILTNTGHTSKVLPHNGSEQDTVGQLGGIFTA